MTDYKKAVERMIRRGELVLDRVDEEGTKIYKRSILDLKNDFLINGVLASTLSNSYVNEVLTKWNEEGKQDNEIED